jgi:hypothetical protein
MSIGLPLPESDEKYVQTHKFRSAAVDRAGGVATPLYTTATTPARTAGRSITIWWIIYYNHSGSVATVWLEVGGVPITGILSLADGQCVIVNVKPLDIGNNDVTVNASANNVQAQIGGIET